MPASVDVSAVIKQSFPQLVERPSVDHPAFSAPAGDVPAVLAFLRDSHGYDLLTDITAIDNGEDATPRFTVVYHVFSTTAHTYIRLAADCSDDRKPSIASVTSLWPGADWHEREVFDMFGITFDGHPDMRRILMWEGYPYHPLRKEFPLAGIETPLPDIEVSEETGTKVLPAQWRVVPLSPAAVKSTWPRRNPGPKTRAGTKRRKSRCDESCFKSSCELRIQDPWPLNLPFPTQQPRDRPRRRSSDGSDVAIDRSLAPVHPWCTSPSNGA